MNAGKSLAFMLANIFGSACLLSYLYVFHLNRYVSLIKLQRSLNNELRWHWSWHFHFMAYKLYAVECICKTLNEKYLYYFLSCTYKKIGSGLNERDKDLVNNKFNF